MSLALKIAGNSRATLLALAAAVWLAMLLVAGAFAPAGVGAHPCDSENDMDTHEDFHGISCTESAHDDPHEIVIEVDGGRDRELEFRVYPPGAGFLDPNDNVRITLSEFNFSEHDFGTAFDRIKLDGSGNGNEISPSNVDVDGETLTLTLPNPSVAVGDGEYLIVTLDKGSGILTPETPRGFDDPEDGYPVKIEFNDTSVADKNIVVVKNPISSTVPGTAVRIDLETYANVVIPANEEITLDFSGPSAGTGFLMPTSITPSRIKIRSAGETFDPADVLVQGERVTLTVPDDEQVEMGDFAISISQLARIRTPYSAGNRVITVSSFAPHFEDDEITAVIRRTTTVDPLEGPRGGEFTLEGKGYAPGTVTIFDGDDEIINPGETLASVRTSRGSFSADLEARGRLGTSLYKVWTRDSNGVIDSAELTITSSMTFEPATVGVGETLKITIEDWEDDHHEVAAVTVAGEIAHIPTGVIDYENCFEYSGVYRPDDSGVVSVEVTIPANVPPGDQTVSVYSHEQLDHTYANDMGMPDSDKGPCVDLEDGETPGNATGKTVVILLKDTPNPIASETIEIAIKSLTLSRIKAVRGQRLTISGSGFSEGPGDDIERITINGEDVPEDPSLFEVAHDGSMSMTVTVPAGARDGENEVQVAGWDGTLGTGTLTVPDPAIELVPPQGQRGESVLVRGTGFAANGIVLLNYGDANVTGGQSDGRGNFEVAFPVPLDAAIGRTHRVTAVMEVEVGDGRDAIRLEASADHAPPVATVTTSPDPVHPGDLMTVQGENFPPFALVRPVRFASRDITPVPNISTDRNGRFEIEIDVRGVEPGDQPLRVEISGVVVTQIVEVAEPSSSGPPSRVFRDLIEAGVLHRVWYLERSTQDWSFFDPAPESPNSTTWNWCLPVRLCGYISPLHTNSWAGNLSQGGIRSVSIDETGTAQHPQPRPARHWPGKLGMDAGIAAQCIARTRPSAAVQSRVIPRPAAPSDSMAMEAEVASASIPTSMLAAVRKPRS